MSQIMRSYLKFYTDPDTLVKIKEEQDEELVARVAQGNSENNQYVVNDNDGDDISDDDNIIDDNRMEENANVNNVPQQNADIINPVISYQERRKASFRKWYENDENKIKHRNRTKAAYGARYVRELNKGIIDFSKMNEETVEKYGIKKGEDGVFYI